MSVAQAFEFFQNNDLVQAQVLCEQILQQNPQDADALHILGVIQNKQGSHQQALQTLTQACEVNPNNPEAWSNLSLVYRALADTTGMLDATLRCLNLNAGMTTAWVCRADAHIRLRDWPQVETCWNALKTLKPQSPQAMEIITAGVLASGPSDLAEKICNDVIELFPHHAEFHVHRSVLHYNKRQWHECIADCQRAQSLDNTTGWQNAGSAYQALNMQEMAVACYQEALKYPANHSETLSNMCVALSSLGRIDEALQAATRSIEINPQHPPAFNNRGTVYVMNNQLDLAISDFEYILSTSHNHTDARFNLGICRFKQNAWVSAWNHWEYRLHVHSPKRAEIYKLDIPIYTGYENLTGKTMLIHHEQGYGDSVQFVRYCKWLSDQQCCVVVLVPAPLEPLLKTFSHARVVHKVSDLAGYTFDYQCAMMSLPYTQHEKFTHTPCDIPYLHADGLTQHKWQQQMPAHHKIKVALAWGGNPQHSNNRIRNIPLEYLKPLFKLPLDFVVVQNNPLSKTEQDLVDTTPNLWLPDNVNDFQDTASLIQLCDITVTVDTSVAHVSGALGRRTWVMLPFASCWRWGSQDTTTTPWYPNMTLLRQPARQDWSSVVKDLSWQLLNML